MADDIASGAAGVDVKQKDVSETETKIHKLPLLKTGYEWLDEMRHIRNVHLSYKPSFSPLTNRASFIINVLNELGIPYELDIFDESGDDLFDYSCPKLLNIIVKFSSKIELPAIIFSAHHDISNPNSEN